MRIELVFVVRSEYVSAIYHDGGDERLIVGWVHWDGPLMLSDMVGGVKKCWRSHSVASRVFLPSNSTASIHCTRHQHQLKIIS